MTVRIENGRLVADTAAELDAYLAGERAYEKALEDGATDEDALAAGRKALNDRAAEQVLRSLGVR